MTVTTASETKPVLAVPNRLIVTGPVSPSDIHPIKQHAWKPNGRLTPTSFQLTVCQLSDEKHARLVKEMEGHYRRLCMPHGVEKSVESQPRGNDFYRHLFRLIFGFDVARVYGVFHGRTEHGLDKHGVVQCDCRHWLSLSDGKKMCSAQVIEELLGDYVVCVLGQPFRTWRFADTPRPGFIPKLWGEGEQDLLPLAS